MLRSFESTVIPADLASTMKPVRRLLGLAEGSVTARTKNQSATPPPLFAPSERKEGRLSESAERGWSWGLGGFKASGSEDEKRYSRDPELGAVKDVLVAFFDGFGGDSSHVRAGRGFGDTFIFSEVEHGCRGDEGANIQRLREGTREHMRGLSARRRIQLHIYGTDSTQR